MAGIGFILRKLYRQDNLSGLVRACLHSAFASTGPWLFTILALGSVAVISRNIVGNEVLLNFQVVLIYNFSFSLVISGPIFMVAIRYVSDAIYKNDVSNATGMLVGSLILLWGIEIIVGVWFYFFYANLSPAMAISAVINFLLLSAIWLISIFISALKNYQLITRAFLHGMLVAMLSCILLAEPFGATGMLNGFNIGIAVIIATLLASVLAEYPYPIQKPFAFLHYFRKYWELALGGLVYNMAVWADKWIMWFAPEALRMESGLVTYPHYDSSMFIAYLTTVPAMAMFLFSAETHFFEKYAKFYRDIEQKANFSKITQNHQDVIQGIFGNAGYFFLIQGSIAIFGMIMAPEIIAALEGNYIQIGMLRYGFLGAFFQILTFFLFILLSYFDNRKASLFIQVVFLLTNAILTWISMRAGFQYYGFGYFLSQFITFILACGIITKYVSLLPYHTFITTNSSVR